MLNLDWLPALIYLAIGIFFGELSLRVRMDNGNPYPRFTRAMTYFIAIVMWPMIVVLSVLPRGK